MVLRLNQSLQEARETYRITRRGAEKIFHCSSRVLEGYEYNRSRTPLEIIRTAAETFRSPELLDGAYDEYPQEWPRIPLPQVIENSLLANVAKQAKEASENAQAAESLMMHTYGKETSVDLTSEDQAKIEIILGEGAEAVRAFKKFCLVLVKSYGYSMAEIDNIIAQRLGATGQRQKNKATYKAAK